MAEADILARLTELFRDVFDDPSIALTPTTTAADIEGWDSFAHVNLIVAIELHFGLKFRTAEIEGLRNVGEMVRVIERKLAEARR